MEVIYFHDTGYGTKQHSFGCQDEEVKLRPLLPGKLVSTGK